MSALITARETYLTLPPFLIHLLVSFLARVYTFSNTFVNTYVIAALSSRFNRVSVVAIEKHPTKEERSREGKEEEKSLTPACVV